MPGWVRYKGVFGGRGKQEQTNSVFDVLAWPEGPCVEEPACYSLERFCHFGVVGLEIIDM
jgi:hypothetical protein